uniref:MSP domain-containing protein n=1 Tax=Mesocestoides corti TaxID=53468 RepID=A0A5K3EWN8_MESCO
VDPEIDLVLPKEGINFGLLRIDEEAKRSIVLRNNGPLKIRYRFRFTSSKNPFGDFQEVFHVKPETAILQPAHSTTDLVILCKSSYELDLNKETILECEVE